VYPRRVRGERPGPWWWGLGRDLLLGAVVGAVVGAAFQDLAFGAGLGAAVGGLLHVYFRLRVR
jgi:hypothetical protein